MRVEKHQTYENLWSKWLYKVMQQASELPTGYNGLNKLEMYAKCNNFGVLR